MLFGSDLLFSSSSTGIVLDSTVYLLASPVFPSN